eukprot:5653518-Amphidinium_carterae.1
MKQAQREPQDLLSVLYVIAATLSLSFVGSTDRIATDTDAMSCKLVRCVVFLTAFLKREHIDLTGTTLGVKNATASVPRASDYASFFVSQRGRSSRWRIAF